MSNDFDKYLAIANHDIQMANDYGQLKSYVASILYDYDKKVELLQQKENIIKEVREYVKTKMEIRKNCENVYSYDIRNDDYIKQVDELLEILDKGSNDEEE